MPLLAVKLLSLGAFYRHDQSMLSDVQGIARLKRYAWMLCVFAGGSTLWFGLLSLRPFLILPRCILHPSQCDPSSLYFFDQVGFVKGSDVADALSDCTQNISALMIVVFPWFLTKTGRLKLHFSHSIETFWAFLIATTTNGICSEMFHLLTQRPRPFVLAGDLRQYGHDFAHYASMYSGHTSFTALVWSFAYVRSQNWQPISRFFLAWVGFMFVFLTGVLRVLAAKHYISDVLVGSFFGSLFGVVFGSWDYRRAQKSR